MNSNFHYVLLVLFAFIYTLIAAMYMATLPQADVSNVHGIIVGGLSSNHINEAQVMVYTVQKNFPESWKIMLFNLIDDWTQQQSLLVASWCRVEIRNFGPMPTYMKYSLQNSAWKARVIQKGFDEVPHNGIVLYVDASIRFLRPVTMEMVNFARRIGIGCVEINSHVSLHTHPHMVHRLHLLKPQFIPNRKLSFYNSTRMVMGGFMLWAKVNVSINLLFHAWSLCLNDRMCVLPTGASGFVVGQRQTPCIPDMHGHCHYGDQSALSIILSEYYNVTRLYRRTRLPYLLPGAGHSAHANPSTRFNSSFMQDNATYWFMIQRSPASVRPSTCSK